MTTPSTERKAGPLLGTGSQTSWPFTFKVFAETDIAVTIADSLGVETALVYGVDYSVSLNANQETSPGGTVTYPISGNALPTGSRLVIVGNLPYDQPLDLPAGGNFSPLAIENQLDRLTMQIQQLRERLGRALQVSVTTNANATLPAPSANQLISWDASGTTLQNVPLADIATALAFATYRYDTFTGDGVETQFTLTADPAVIGNLDVAVGGVTQTPGTDYTLTSGVLVFDLAPPLGVTILARYGEGLSPGSIGGANDISYSPAGTGAVTRTVENKLRDFVSVTDFADADPTGVADSTTAIVNAMARALAANAVLNVNGQFRYTSQITVPAKLRMVGAGITSYEDTGSRSRSCLIKDFDGLGVLFNGDDCLVDGVQFDSVDGRTGDNVQVTGSRFCAPAIAVTNAGQDGLRIGQTGSTGTGASLQNANLWYIGRIAALGNGRYGINIDDTNTGGSGNWPLGTPDCNAGYIGLAETDRNGVDGLRFGNTIDNHVAYVVAQSNTGYGVRFDPHARNNTISKSYTEANTAGDGIIAANATQNIVFASSRAVTLGNGWTNNGGNSNLLLQHVSTIGQDGAFNSCPWLWGPEFYAVNQATNGQVFLGGYVDANLPAWLRIEKGAGTGTKMTLVTKRNGNTPLDRLSVDESGLTVLQNTTGFAIGKTANDTTTAGIYLGDTGSGSNTRINMVGSGSSSDTKFAFYNSNGQVGTITTNGTATAYNVSSDYRLKTDAHVMDGAAALAAVMSWPIKSFTWKATGVRDVGVIAHELQAVKPTAVSGEKDAVRDGEIDPQGVDYGKLVPELVAAVQHLASLVLELRKA